MPSAEALARVRAGRNPLYKALTVQDADPDDRLALAPLLEARDETALRDALDGLTATPGGREALARHLADIRALAAAAGRSPELAGTWLSRLYGR